MENKMTDNEIIKALEFCAEHVRNCAECPLNVTSLDHCSTRLAQNVLNLINRQKAEIERLDALNTDVFAGKVILQIKLENAKAEAIKEFQNTSRNRLIELYKKYYDIANPPKK